jgi:endonuclease/exonuclease/phosphatase family metal-dependent hydrolase
MFKRLCVIAALFALVGGIEPNAKAQNKNRNFIVMTRNMDTGSDYNFVLAAKTQFEAAVAVDATYKEILASGIPERADAIAAEIQQQLPDLVALQEVTTLRKGPVGGPATDVEADQLKSLLDSLNSRGVHYAPAAIQRNSDLEFTALELSSFTFYDARVTDFDVVLARTDLPVSQLKVEQVTQEHFTTILEFNMFGQTISVPRGWIAVDVKLRGKPYRLVDTHLESINYPVQIAQTLELVNGPTLANRPVILAGDINSDGSGSDAVLSASYQILVSAGFQDFWPVAHPLNPGFTNPLHGEDPYTPISVPNQRIDVILSKTNGKGIEAQEEFLIGNNLSDLTPQGFWPSDHAGVVESFRLLP